LFTKLNSFDSQKQKSKRERKEKKNTKSLIDTTNTIDKYSKKYAFKYRYN